MPKLTWMDKKAPPRVDNLAALFRAYRKSTGMTSVQIAKKARCTPENARRVMNKSGELLRIGDLLRYCDILGIPRQDAFKMAVLDYDTKPKGE